MNKPSIIMCLATEKGLAVAQSLANLTAKARFTVCTFREQNSLCFEGQIRDAALQADSQHFGYSDWKSNAAQIVSETKATMIVCVGWRYLIPDDVTAQVGGSVIVAHDSLLPKFRGFAPLPSALIAGETETGVTFLRATNSVDAGPIYWRDSFPIAQDDTIANLIRKTLPIYVAGTRRAVLGQFAEPQSQDEAAATYSVWRDQEDYWLDWGQSAEQIERTIRALGPPYSGARTRVGGRTAVIRRARIEPDVSFVIRNSGKIWCLDSDGCPVVVCGSGLLKILDGKYEDGGQESLTPFKKLRVRLTH